jgi:hypothetical protein
VEVKLDALGSPSLLDPLNRVADMVIFWRGTFSAALWQVFRTISTCHQNVIKMSWNFHNSHKKNCQDTPRSDIDDFDIKVF